MIPKSLMFLFARPQREQLVVEHVIREHHRGRALAEIIHDAYVTNRCSSEEIERLLDRPEIAHAVGQDVRAAHRPTL